MVRPITPWWIKLYTMLANQPSSHHGRFVRMRPIAKPQKSRQANAGARFPRAITPVHRWSESTIRELSPASFGATADISSDVIEPYFTVSLLFCEMYNNFYPRHDRGRAASDWVACHVPIPVEDFLSEH